MKDEYCTKCGNCCKQIVVDFSKNIIFRDGVQNLTSDFLSMLIPVEKKGNTTICTCKHLSNNICTNQNKPEECKNYPSSPFAFLQDECGYYGAVFLEREKFMQKIRKLKEEIIHYQALIPISSKEEAKQYEKIINRHQSFLDKYKIYIADF